MEKYIVARHFINNEESLNEFEKGIDNLIIGLGLSKRYKLNFGLKLTTNDNINEELREKIKKKLEGLPLNLWLLYDPKNRGSGVSFRQIVFNPTFYEKKYIIGSIDIDQLSVKGDSLELLIELMEKVEKENTLYAPGSRDIQVKLAVYEKNSNLRKIHELFHSLAISSEKLIVKDDKYGLNADAAYKKIGESTTGVSIFNTTHPNYPELINYTMRMARIADLTGFAGEYYTAIRSSLLGGISTGYIRAKENKFYHKKDEQTEKEGITNMIITQTRELGRTDIRNLLEKTIKENRNMGIISEFYDKSEVEFIRDLMLKGLMSN